MECSQSKEDQIQLALNAFKNGQFKTKKSASLAFNVSETTLHHWLQGIASHSEKAANCQKLSNTEELTLLSWILDMDKHGLPLQLLTICYLAQLLVSAYHGLLSSSQPFTIRENWVNCYIQHHLEFKLKYTWKYDYQHVKCESSKLIEAWFKYVKKIIEKYGIIKKDIYNIDETGF